MSKLRDDIKTLTIDRATWRTGAHGQGSAFLLNRFGERCCLGFLAQACGVPDGDMIHVTLPSQLRLSLRDRMPRQLFGPLTTPWGEQAWQYSFALINDKLGIDDATRESWIATGFRIVLGIEVEFTGRYSL